MFSPYGTIESIRLLHSKKIGFDTFMNRPEAEAAITKLYDCLFVKGKRLRLDWGKSRRQMQNPGIDPAASGPIIPGPPGMPDPGLAAAQVPIFSADDTAYLLSRGLAAPQMPQPLQNKGFQ